MSAFRDELKKIASGGEAGEVQESAGPAHALLGEDTARTKCPACGRSKACEKSACPLRMKGRVKLPTKLDQQAREEIGNQETGASAAEKQQNLDVASEHSKMSSDMKKGLAHAKGITALALGLFGAKKVHEFSKNNATPAPRVALLNKMSSVHDVVLVRGIPINSLQKEARKRLYNPAMHFRKKSVLKGKKPSEGFDGLRQLLARELG